MMVNAGRKFYFLAIFCVFILGTVEAQQDPAFSQFWYTTQYYNPAYSGVSGFSDLNVLHRTQYAGYRPTFDESGNPVTQYIALSTPIFRIRSGAGLYLINDKIGPMTNLQIQASYAYHLAVGKSKLSFGFNIGVWSQAVNFDDYRFFDPDDPLIGSGKQSQVQPDMGVGLYYRAEKYWGGIAVKHIISTKFDFGSDQLRGDLNQTIYFDAGYKYEVNYDFVLRPMLLVKTDFNTYAIDLALLGTYKERFIGGLSYRQQESVTATLGYNALKQKNLRLSYAIDLVVQGTDAKSLTSHEFTLGYMMPVLTGGGKKVVRTPRFRH